MHVGHTVNTSQFQSFALHTAPAPPPSWAVLQEQRDLPPPTDAKRDRDGLCALTAEVMQEGHSTLIFCGGTSSYWWLHLLVHVELGSYDAGFPYDQAT